MDKLYALSFQIIEQPAGILIKRGCLTFKINAPHISSLLHSLLKHLPAEGISETDLLAQFTETERPRYKILLDALKQRQLIVTTPPTEQPESPDALFYWHFQQTPQTVAEKLSAQQIAIVGINTITIKLGTLLQEAGVAQVQWLDDPVLRHLPYFDTAGHLTQTLPYPITLVEEQGSAIPVAAPPKCLIAAADFGGQHTLLAWNQYCVNHNILFLPILLQDLIGYLGPLVVPGETACLACLRARSQANRQDFALWEQIDTQVSTHSAVGFHPLMSSMLAELAVLELTKFYAEIPAVQVGHLIKVNLLATQMHSHKVLKIPRCPVCSTLNRQPAPTLSVM